QATLWQHPRITLWDTERKARSNYRPIPSVELEVGLLLLMGLEAVLREGAPHPRHTLPCSPGTAQRCRLGGSFSFSYCFSYCLFENPRKSDKQYECSGPCQDSPHKYGDGCLELLG